MTDRFLTMPLSPRPTSSTRSKPRTGRIPIVEVQPAVDCGHYPAKAVVSEAFEVSATIFREGHALLGANIVLRGPKGAPQTPWAPMREPVPGTDRWLGTVAATAEGDWTFHVEAWDDPIATWLHDARIKIAAEQDEELVLADGALVFEAAAQAAPKGADRTAYLALAAFLGDASRSPSERLARSIEADVAGAISRHPLRRYVTRSDRMPLRVERERALFSAWYEFFPRSEGAVVPEPDSQQAPTSGTLVSAAERLPAIAAMGFDVVYIPPVHPIGTTFRKGPNNSLDPGPDDVGVPWAIGSADGGHDAIHPDLGTLADFDRFVRAARDLGLEVAMDFALQTSPDHPWVKEHPDWFTTRADGSVAYAENPPKKYQDIYPLNFDNDPDGILAESLRLLRHWIEHGVRIFRVDNPHTKPVFFWERLLGEVRASNPDVLFLAEAFTRPAMMRQLARIGFHQSYTYFTWRTSKRELTEYISELRDETGAFLRPNFFVNTPDILHASLQYGGPAAFKQRAALAALLSPSWGVYSGYELYEHVAVRPGSEEYLDSEKYQLRPRDWEAAEREGRSLAPFLGKLNQIRREHPALHFLRNVRFHGTEDDDVIAFSKRYVNIEHFEGSGNIGDPEDIEDYEDYEDIVIGVVNLDPHGVRETMVNLDLAELGLDGEEGFEVRDLLSGTVWRWGARNYVRLDPFVEPAHILSVRRLSASNAAGRPDRAQP